MTQEEKELLLVDLSARFPYNVAIDCRSEDSRFTCYLTTDMLREIQNNTCYWEYKPFLFPFSSMTEEQSKIYHELIGGMFGTSTLINFEVLEDFFHKNHLDYKGLIEKGLAINATGLNIY